jgi:hypothetical protein
MLQHMSKFPTATTPFANLLMRRLKLVANSESGHCYILGNGGSLKHIDFSLLNPDIAIGCNLQFLHNESNSINLKYFTHLDPIAALGEVKTPLRAQFEEYIKEHDEISFFLSMRDMFRVTGSNVYHLAPLGNNWPGNRDHRKQLQFRSDSQPLLGSLRGQINLAIFLGFTSATLLGHDYLLTPTRSGHFYELGQGALVDLNGWNSDFIMNATKFIELSIVSPEPATSVIQIVSMTESPTLTARYRENFEIIDDLDLQILAEANNRFGFGYTLN